MAFLTESDLWPIHSARKLHDKAQQGFLWQFFMTGAVPSLDRDMMMLAESCSLPGIKFDQKNFVVAGQKQNYLGPSQRGGQVNARFLETEGGQVDTFFRLWANLIDVPTTEILRPWKISRWRRGQGFGDGISGHARSAIVRLIKRNGEVGVELLVVRLKLVEFGGYNLNYADSKPMVMPVTMVCDDVIRNVTV